MREETPEPEMTTSFLKLHSLFRETPDSTIERVKPLLALERFPEGAEIIRLGTPNPKVYFIVSGSVRIEKQGREVDVLGEGETFGEMEFLDIMPAAASVRAVGPVTVATCTGKALRSLGDDDPGAFSLLMMNLARNLSRRLRERDARDHRFRDPADPSSARDGIASCYKEIHHRIKANLQVVSSLLSLQAEKSPDFHVRRALLQSRNRILSMSLAHESSYIESNPPLVPLGDYVQRLAENVMANEMATVSGTYRIADVKMAVDRAVRLGLVTGELVMNSCRHAFVPGQRGKISIELDELDGNVTFRYGDDGIGLPERVASGLRPELGLEIVDNLVAELDGYVKSWNSNGARFEIGFPLVESPEEADN